MKNTILKLRCPVQHYSWGNFGDTSLVAQLVGQSDSEQPYAELWLGAHPSAPSEVELANGKLKLDALIRSQPQEILGESVSKQFNRTLPFLFKILSVRTALSIQAHPDRVLAQALHKRDPKNYPDDNHKPEMALPLSDLELLYGFRPLDEIREFFETVPELATLAGPKIAQRLFSQEAKSEPQLVLREVVENVCAARSELLAVECRSLVQRLSHKCERTSEEQWISQLGDDFPQGDVGLFFFFIMNYRRLSAGQAIFIPPNTPHAYLRGELVECMANSDNVVRAGLTKKFRDVATLLSMLQYKTSDVQGIEVQNLTTQTKRYLVPAAEFFVEEVFGENVNLVFSPSGQVEVVFCLQGNLSLSNESTSLELSAGEAAIVPSPVVSYSLLLSHGRAFRVGIPS